MLFTVCIAVHCSQNLPIVIHHLNAHCVHNTKKLIIPFTIIIIIHIFLFFFYFFIFLFIESFTDVHDVHGHRWYVWKNGGLIEVIGQV